MIDERSGKVQAWDSLELNTSISAADLEHLPGVFYSVSHSVTVAHNSSHSASQQFSQPGTEPVNEPSTQPISINSFPISAIQGTEGFLRRLSFLLFLAIPMIVFGFNALKKKENGKSTEDVLDRQWQPSFTFSFFQSRNINLSPTQAFGRQTSAEAGSDDEDGSTDQDKRGTLWENFLAGIVIALGCMPESIAFSFITGVSPLNGMWAGVVMGMYTSLLGGRPGMISCSSAATAVVLVDVSSNPEYGLALLPVSVFVGGVLQIIAGALRLSRFISLVPHPVMLGFVNGLAIVIARAQIAQFQLADGSWVDSNTMWGMITTTGVSMAAAVLFPRIPRIGHLLPGPLVAIIAAIIWSAITSSLFKHRILIDIAGQATFSSGYSTLPVWNFPPAFLPLDRVDLLKKAIVTGIRMGLVGIVESLLTLTLLDQITETRGSGRAECIALGCGNLVSSLFGLQGGCALLAQSLLNVGSGGKGRFSGFVMASGLGLSIVIMAPVIGLIPCAALVGIMFIVALNTFAWGSLSLLQHISWVDLAVIVLVTLVTVFCDLATAVLCGLFLSAIAFAWTSACDVQVDVSTVKDAQEFRVQGPLFFGSAMAFQKKIEPSRIPVKNVRVYLGKILDHSALEAIVKTDVKLKAAGKVVQWNGMSEDAEKYLARYGSSQDMICAPEATDLIEDCTHDQYDPGVATSLAKIRGGS